MQESASLHFPFKYDNENECLLRAFTVEDTIISAIKCFLCTRKGSRVGTTLGSFLPELLFQGIPLSRLASLGDELKDELESQFSGCTFLEVELTRELTAEVSSLNVNIKLAVSTNPNVLDINLSLPSIFTK